MAQRVSVGRTIGCMAFVLRRSFPSITGLLALVLAIGALFVAFLGAPVWFPAIFAVLIIGIQFRMTIAISAKRTDVHLLPTTLKGVPDEINVARLRAHEAFYGPSGGGAPDDVEMFNRCTDGLRVKGAEWLELSRGIEREHVDGDGVTIGHITDEVPQRAFYRRWKAAMCASF